MSHYPHYFAVIAHNTEQHRGFGSGLPPEQSHICPGGNFFPVWEPVMKDQANNCFTGKK